MELGNNVVVGGGKQGAKLWDWTQQSPEGATVLQAGFSLELLPPAVSTPFRLRLSRAIGAGSLTARAA